jgi:hypothetical protein
LSSLQEVSNLFEARRIFNVAACAGHFLVNCRLYRYAGFDASAVKP